MCGPPTGTPMRSGLYVCKLRPDNTIASQRYIQPNTLRGVLQRSRCLSDIFHGSLPSVVKRA
jgi:hypothetical protein